MILNQKTIDASRPGFVTRQPVTRHAGRVSCGQRAASGFGPRWFRCDDRTQESAALLSSWAVEGRSHRDGVPVILFPQFRKAAGVITTPRRCSPPMVQPGSIPGRRVPGLHAEPWRSTFASPRARCPGLSKRSNTEVTACSY